MAFTWWTTMTPILIEPWEEYEAWLATLERKRSSLDDDLVPDCGSWEEMTKFFI